jgi:hypothetical protein
MPDAKRYTDKARVAKAAYDKPGYAAAKRAALGKINEDLAANEKVKAGINKKDPGGAAKAAIRSKSRANTAAMKEASKWVRR